MGRPTKLTDLIVHKVASCILEGLSMSGAARAVNLHQSTLHAWLRRGELGEEGFSAFSAAIKKAESDLELEVIGNIKRAAMQGTWTASAWLAERRWPDSWGRRDAPTEAANENGEGEQRTPRQEAEYLEALASAIRSGLDEDEGDHAA